uniref:Serpin domain-containing protein n=1 Tax=Biomphalaria glabrata TaxID=6526 RepID=A0A2C9JYM5_BIOGL
MMHGSERGTFMKKDDVNNVDVAEIPFRGRRFALYIALPRACDGITDLENLLQQPGKVDELFTGLQFETVEMTIPKFRIETKLDLEDVLVDMGMVKALSEVQADLSGISQGVYISRVIHQAVIDVQESGTVAAAVTVGEISFFSIPVIVPFIADHPFLYFLRDKETGQILFQGRFSG